MVDPRVDILSAPWDPFTDTPWILPVLSELSKWREALKIMRQRISGAWEQHMAVFVADFPGTVWLEESAVYTVVFSFLRLYQFFLVYKTRNNKYSIYA